MSDDWNAFIKQVPWFLRPGQSADVGESREGAWNPAGVEFQRLFPKLHRLLSLSRVTPVRAREASYVLFSWLDGPARRAWLAEPPVLRPPTDLFPAHATLLQSFGGILERNEPLDSWLMNHNDVLTLREAGYDASFLRGYAWAFEKTGGQLPIDPTAFYSIAREANGNDTLCHRSSGRVILFAPDHSFEHVVPMQGCPDYTLYELDGAKTFVDWVNVIAEQWLEGLDEPQEQRQG